MNLSKRAERIRQVICIPLETDGAHWHSEHTTCSVYQGYIWFRAQHGSWLVTPDLRFRTPMYYNGTISPVVLYLDGFSDIQPP